MYKRSASAIAGSPKTPCSGSGLCDLHETRIDSPLAMNVELSTSGNDLTMKIPADQMRLLQQTHKDIFNSLDNEKQFKFDDHALPFYIDYNICKDLWPDAPDNYHYYHIDRADNCIVEKLDDGSVTINFPSVVQNSVTDLYGATGSMDRGQHGTDFVAVGSWMIGTDVYGNLLFQSDGNSVSFGALGNISCKRYSVQLSGEIVDMGTFNVDTLINKWYIGTEPNGNLVISNTVNTVRFGLAASYICMVTNQLLTKNAQVPIPDPIAGTTAGGTSNPFGGTAAGAAGTPDPFEGDAANGMRIGNNWRIYEDGNKNLCFEGNNQRYYFGANGGIYVGEIQIVAMQYPGGGDVPEN